VLGNVGDSRAVEPLQRLLDHSTWFVRYCACEALITLHAVNVRVVAELESLLTHHRARDYDYLARSGDCAVFGEEGGAPLTLEKVLEKARNALSLRTDNNSAPET
jgi:hypothetical protein